MSFRLDMGGIAPGMAVGLFGGSFDPPHAGHVHFSREALKRFGLDRVVWLVSPGNPLKAEQPAAFEARLARCRAMVTHPAIHVSSVEAQLGTRITAQTLAALQRRYPRVRFVWLMGADNLAQLHRWTAWRAIMQSVPVGVLARPGHRMAARQSRAARIYAGARLPDRASRLLGVSEAPCWCFCNMPMRADASTDLRRAGVW